MAQSANPLPPAGAAGTNLMSIDPQINWRRYPSVPITKAMTDRVNLDGERKPDYANPDDWVGGLGGNDVDASSANVVAPDFTPRHQPDRLTAGNWSAGSVTADDVGKDYGQYAGQAGRVGVIEPAQPYPSVVVQTTVTPAAFLPANFIPPVEGP